MSTNRKNNLELAIFDLGNVCFETPFEECFRIWEERSSLETGTAFAEYMGDDVFHRWERGEISTDEYWRHFCDVLNAQIEFDDWIHGWISIFGKLIQATFDCILDMKRSGLEVVALSNTNEVHVAHWQNHYPDLAKSFDAIHVSNEVGMRKPESRIFEYVLSQHSVSAERAVFFDDKLENVQAAESLGIEGVHFTSDMTAIDWWQSD